MIEIKAGDYIRHTYTIELYEDDAPKTMLEEILEEESPKSNDEKAIDYYLVLDAEENNIEITIFRGTPVDKTAIHDYEEVQANYTLVDVGEDVAEIPLYNEYFHNGLDRYIYAGTKYLWHGKELFIPTYECYWNGSGWAKSPDGFGGELKRSMIDLHTASEIKGE